MYSSPPSVTLSLLMLLIFQKRLPPCLPSSSPKNFVAGGAVRCYVFRKLGPSYQLTYQLQFKVEILKLEGQPLYSVSANFPTLFGCRAIISLQFGGFRFVWIWKICSSDEDPRFSTAPLPSFPCLMTQILTGSAPIIAGISISDLQINRSRRATATETFIDGTFESRGGEAHPRPQVGGQEYKIRVAVIGLQTGLIKFMTVDRTNFWASSIHQKYSLTDFVKAKIVRALSFTSSPARPWIPVEYTDGGISPPDHQFDGISSCAVSDKYGLTFVGGPSSTLHNGGRKVSRTRVLNIGPSPNLGVGSIGGKSSNYIIMDNDLKADPLPCPITGCVPLRLMTCRWSPIESLSWTGTMRPRAFFYRSIKSETALVPHALFRSLNLEALPPCEDTFQSLKQQSNFSYSEFSTAFYGDRIREDPAFDSEATSHLQHLSILPLCLSYSTWNLSLLSNVMSRIYDVLENNS